MRGGFFATAVLLIVVMGQCARAEKQRVFFASDFGAKGDGVVLDTAAIQKAIDAAAAVKGTATFRPGTYLTGSLFLKSGVTLEVPEGVTLVGSERLEDYPELPTRIAGIEMTWPAALVNVRDQEGVTITGKGTIDGDGAVWWKSYWDLRATVRAEGAAVGVGLRREAAAAAVDPEFVACAAGRRDPAEAIGILDRADFVLAQCACGWCDHPQQRGRQRSFDGWDRYRLIA